jgi:type IV secretory pathway TraG/TraD family ATPase VirD4
MGSFYNNRGMSSLLGNDSVNIFAATNTDNNSEYIVITRYWATGL